MKANEAGSTARPEEVALLKQWLNEGWKFRLNRHGEHMNEHRAEYVDRVAQELELLESKDFVSYFLVVSDLVRWAKDSGIPVGPGRGSSGSSLICWLLRITELNPMVHTRTRFSRFIDPTRADLPDIDVDISDDRRSELWDYASAKYGAEHIGTIGNFIRYRGRNSLDDVARAYRLPKWSAERIKGFIMDRSGGDSRAVDSLEDTFATYPAAEEVAVQFPEYRHAIRLEGNLRNMGIHAAGMVLSNTPIPDICAVYQRKTADGAVTKAIALDKKDAEALGLLKIDLLGLNTMGMLGLCLKWTGMTLEDMYALPIDDPNVIDVFRRTDLAGIFQFEGRSTRFINREVDPTNFSELADISALSRPGPLFSGTKTQYVDVKHGRTEQLHLHPILDRITESTYGQIVYQEQVLDIIREIGGFPMSDVHAIRRIISQKLGEAQFNELFAKFEEGAQRLHGIESALALRIWRYLATSATYSFVNAHSEAYTLISWYCAYFKHYHPAAFFAAQLCKTSDAERTQYMANDARRHGISILPPKLGVSGVNWEPDGADTVRMGLTQIPGIAHKTANRIIAAVEDGTIDTDKGWYGLAAMKGIGPKTIAKIDEFANNPDPLGLNRTGEIMQLVRDALQDGMFGHHIPVPHYTSDTIPQTGQHHDVAWVGIPKVVRFASFKEDERARYGKTIEEIEATMKDPHLDRRAAVFCYDDGQEDVILRVNRWKLPALADKLENMRCDGTEVVIAVGMKREDFGVTLHVQDLWVIELEA